VSACMPQAPAQIRSSPRTQQESGVPAARAVRQCVHARARRSQRGAASASGSARPRKNAAVLCPKAARRQRCRCHSEARTGVEAETGFGGGESGREWRDTTGANVPFRGSRARWI
jgi:hypothetical protein